MARRKINKAAKIRETFEKLGVDARPKDVIAALAAEKIQVSSAQVSNVKATLNGHGPKGRGGKKQKSGELTVAMLQEAKQLVASLGSVERAMNALAALAKLQS